MNGYCQCGCGEKTPLAKKTYGSKGIVKGQPLRFIRGHQCRKSPHLYRVDPKTGCWVWQRSGGRYGRLMVDGVGVQAHRHFFEQAKGPIPDGLQLDHLCRNTFCVNPEHLEPVSGAENSRRGVNAKLMMALSEEIRALYAGGETQVDLATRFGISQSVVSKVVRREGWTE